MKVSKDMIYRTKGGHPVVIYAIYEGQSFGVQGAWQDATGVWHVCAWMVSGRADIFGPTDLDLAEVRPERVVWINEYPDGKGFVWATKKQADRGARDTRIALHRVVLNEDTVWREKVDE